MLELYESRAQPLMCITPAFGRRQEDQEDKVILSYVGKFEANQDFVRSCLEKK